MFVMPFDPHPPDIVDTREMQECFPEIPVGHLLFLAVFPAVPEPLINP
jgi:hypothetical protein